MDINDLYSYIRQNTTDDYDILKNKIDEFLQEGLEPIRIYNIISQYIVLVHLKILYLIVLQVYKQHYYIKVTQE